MNAPARIFEDRPAVREKVPLLLGLMGPSGSGKTFSALRLARGIQSVTGGDIYGIDTEARRMLHYADRFKFRHIPFGEPFGSLDYLAALRHCVNKGAGVVIVDSMSHEHEGPGGMLDFYDKEIERLAGDDYGKRERMKMLAWQKPKAARAALVNGMLQLNCNFIFCFRAKERVKPVQVNGKTQIVPQGFTPIAGDEFVYEMTANCLLLPNAKGAPTWASDQVGERMMIKLPAQFAALFADGRALDEDMGIALAEWAKGSSSGPAAARSLAEGEPDPYEAYADDVLADEEQTAASLKNWWNSDQQKTNRAGLARDRREALKARVMARIAELDRPAAEQKPASELVGDGAIAPERQGASGPSTVTGSSRS